MISIKELKKIVYSYYPAENILAFTDSYYNTEEIKKLYRLSEYYKLNNNLWNNLCLKIKELLPDLEVTDVSYNYDGWLTRSYGLTINLETSNIFQTIIDINVSYLIPYYTVSILRFKKIDDSKWEHPPFIEYSLNDLEKNDLLDKVRKCVQETLKYKEFPVKLLFVIVPRVSFEAIKEGEFNFLNAFFINDYRIRF